MSSVHHTACFKTQKGTGASHSFTLTWPGEAVPGAILPLEFFDKFHKRLQETSWIHVKEQTAYSRTSQLLDLCVCTFDARPESNLPNSRRLWRNRSCSNTMLKQSKKSHLLPFSLKRKQVKKAIKNCKAFSMSNKAKIPVIWLLIHNSSPGQHFQAVLWIIKTKNLHQARNINKVSWTCQSVARRQSLAVYFITAAQGSAIHIYLTAHGSWAHVPHGSSKTQVQETGH